MKGAIADRCWLDDIILRTNWWSIVENQQSIVRGDAGGNDLFELRKFFHWLILQQPSIRLAIQLFSRSLILNLDPNHKTASVGISSNEERMCVGSCGSASCFDSFKTIYVDLPLETLVSCMVEVALHYSFFELYRIVDFEGITCFPRNDMVEFSTYTLF